MLEEIKRALEIEDIWDMEYDDLNVDRESVVKSVPRLGGSVRLFRGLFLTEEEFDRWEKEALELKLP